MRKRKDSTINGKVRSSHYRRVWQSGLWCFASLVAFPHQVWAEAKYTRWWLPPAASSYSANVDQLFYIILGITAFVFVAVQATLVAFLIKYRYRPGRRAQFIHGNHKLELVWTIIPALILAWLAFYQQGSWTEIKQNFPLEKDSFVVEVTGQQFEWHFNYPGPDGAFGTGDEVETINQLHVPVNVPVLLKLKSKDVIHSFFLPEFRLKQDVVPGMTVPAWFTAITTGAFDVACAELCGLGHYRMRGFLTVHTKEDLDKTLSDLYADAAQEEDDFW